MKLTNIVAIITFILIAAFSINGCTSAPPPVQEESAKFEAISMVPQDESLDATELIDEDSIPLPSSKLKSPESQSTMETSDAFEPIESGLVELPGYRVQLFVTNEEFDARAVEEEALLQFDAAVYLSFDSPNYKIRVGDCKTRVEANELRQVAGKLGYRDAWVVQCKILTHNR